MASTADPQVSLHQMSTACLAAFWRALMLNLKRSIPPLAAQQKPDSAINDRIRQEEEQHSQIMRTLHFLSDVYGPRLTGSPSLKAAGGWSIKTLASGGLR